MYAMFDKYLPVISMLARHDESCEVKRKFLMLTL